MEPLSIFAFLGIVASLYAINVESSASKPKYKAICDIGDNMSCTRVLTSKYARLAQHHFNLKEDSIFNVPNTYYGLLFYVAVLLYSQFPFTLIPFREHLLLSASSFSILFSFYLAYILYAKLKDLCLVCVTTYFINIGILWQAYHQVF